MTISLPVRNLRLLLALGVAGTALCLFVLGRPAPADAGLLVPVVTAISPTGGPSCGGTPLEIQGNGFGAQLPEVLVGDQVVPPAAIQFITPKHLRVNAVPGVALTPGGAVHVQVRTSQGTSAATPVDKYRYAATPPTITSIAPGRGPTGTDVQLQGCLSDVSSVSFGDVPALPTSVTGSTLTVPAPHQLQPGPLTVPVRASNHLGQTEAEDSISFAYPEPPTVTSVSPNFGYTNGEIGSGDDRVVVRGTAFKKGKNPPSVRFGDSIVYPGWFTVVSDTEIDVFVAPGSAGSVPVVVTTSEGDSILDPSTGSSNTFTRIPAVYLRGLSSQYGSVTGGIPSGQWPVVVTGQGFFQGGSSSGIDKLFFGSHTLDPSSYRVVSDTSIEIYDIPPKDATDQIVAYVTVKTIRGKTWSWSQASWTYTPIVTSLTPNTGWTNGQVKVRITGRGFSDGPYPIGVSQVRFGGQSVPWAYKVIDDGHVDVTVPPGTPGTVPVSVTTRHNAESPAAPGAEYTYATPPPPSLTSISPTRGPTDGYGSTRPVIRGHAFQAGPVTVRFGNVTASDVTVVSDDQIDLQKVPDLPGAGAYVVSVTTGAGSSPSEPAADGSNVFVGYQRPVVTGLSESHGPISGGFHAGVQQVVMTGSGFFAGDTVSRIKRIWVGNALADPATYEVVSDTEIDFHNMPARAPSTGSLAWFGIYLDDGNYVSTAGTYWRYEPVVSGLTPSSGSAAGGQTVTIRGIGFFDGSWEARVASVSFGGVAATSVVVQDDRTLTAVVPAGSEGIVDVVVTMKYSNFSSEPNPAARYTYTAP
ncbi:MAG: hypothetical protein QOE92_2221 [Chloroflexota bacterium]|nr:hypothetical protein [Chloroflexota bacterium]